MPNYIQWSNFDSQIKKNVTKSFFGSLFLFNTISFGLTLISKFYQPGRGGGREGGWEGKGFACSVSFSSFSHFFTQNKGGRARRPHHCNLSFFMISKLANNCTRIHNCCNSTNFMLGWLKTILNTFQDIFWWLIIITCYQLMLQSWYLKNAESLSNSLLPFCWQYMYM